MIKNMDAARIQQAWLLSWEIPEREMDPSYYPEVSPGVGMPFRDVIDVVERYPDRLIPGTTVDPREPTRTSDLRLQWISSGFGSSAN